MRASSDSSSVETLPQQQNFSVSLKQQALALGFDKIGIVRAESLSAEARHLDEWLNLGYHADMYWMRRDSEKRSDPRRLFPTARSVIVVALNYFTPAKHQESPTSGKVSRYAWGDDYHDVVGAKLRSLLSWIKEQNPDAEGKVCVDIQPIMDKAWAVRAGLGWLGKHTNVITPELGSWVFIGELLVNLELDYDTGRIEDHCGTCTRVLLKQSSNPTWLTQTNASRTRLLSCGLPSYHHRSKKTSQVGFTVVMCARTFVRGIVLSKPLMNRALLHVQVTSTLRFRTFSALLKRVTQSGFEVAR